MVIAVGPEISIRAQRLLQDAAREMRVCMVLEIGDEVREQEDRHFISSGSGRRRCSWTAGIRADASHLSALLG